MALFRPTAGFGFLGASLLAFVTVAAGCGGGSSSSKDGGTGGTGTTGTGGTGIGGGTGGASGGTGGTTVGGTPAMQCKSLITTVCTRIYGQCKPAGTDAGVNGEATCESQNQVALGCDRAVDSFATCLADTNALSCASLIVSNQVQLPGSCMAPLSTIPPSDAQTKCLNLGTVICTRDAECAGVLNPTDAQLAPCLQDFDSQVPCDLAVTVGASYDTCVSGLRVAACMSADAGTDPDAGNQTIPGCDTAITFFKP